MGVYRASLSMKEFINRMLGIYEHQALISKNEPNMRISYDFPEFEEYPKEYFSVKMLFIGHFPEK